MNTRILQSIWKTQRTNCLTKTLVYATTATAARHSYAIETHCEAWNKAHTIALPTMERSHFKPQLLSVRNFRAHTASQDPGTSSNHRTLERLLQRIDIHYKRHGVVKYESLYKLMEVLEKDVSVYNQLLVPELTEFVLSACGSLLPSQTPEQRMQLFQRLWNYLELHSQLTAKHYRIALEVRRINRSTLPDFRKFLEQISSWNSELVDASLYEQLMEVACESGDIVQATQILAEMREQQHALTERVFNALILGHSRNGDLNGCQTVLENMLAANIPLSSDTQTELVCAHLENGQPEKAIELRQQFQGKFYEVQQLRMLKSAALLSGQVGLELVEKWLLELPQDLLLGTEVTKPIRQICTELIYTGKLDAAVAIVRNLPTPRFNDNQDKDKFGVFLLYELIRSQSDPQKIIDVCSMLVESGKNTRALHVATDLAIHQNPVKGLPFFEALAMKEALRPHYFWPLMMTNFYRWGESGILRTLEIMSSFKVECDDETILYYVFPRLSVVLEDPKEALKAFNKVGIPTSRIFTPIMEHVLRMQKPELAYELLQLYPTKLDCLHMVKPLSSLAVYLRATRQYSDFTKLIEALYSKSDKPNMDFVGLVLLEIVGNSSHLQNDTVVIQRLISDLHKLSVQISATAAELIIGHMKKYFPDANHEVLQKTLENMSNMELSLPNPRIDDTGRVTTVSINQHPRTMSREELECHLVELESKGMNTRGVLRRLLQLNVRDGLLERALQIKHRCDELSVQISPGMLASIFDMYIKLRDADNAEATFQKLKKEFPGFDIDEHKLVDYSALLVSSEKLDKAKSILSERAASGKRIIGGDYITKNLWQFLTNVAHLAAKLDLPRDENLTRETFLFLRKLRYCFTPNTLLGPIVREYLLRNDIHSAVAEFKQLAEEYKRTPLQFELMSLLIKLSNSNNVEDIQRFNVTCEEAKTLLTTVTDTITRIYGPTKMNSSLLVAFAKSGTDNQLRRLVMDPEFRVNNEMLQKDCEHLGDEGAIETLLRLGRCTRGLGHVINDQSIYNMLLDRFKNNNDYEAALELFKRLEEDDELKISQEFLKDLVTLLRINNVEIPSSLALRAQIL